MPLPVRHQLRIGSTLCWVAAWCLAIAGPVVYLAWQSNTMWLLGVTLPLPLFGLALWRREQKGFSDDPTGGDGGAWGPPDGGGGGGC